MRDFLKGGREQPQGQGYARLKIQNKIIPKTSLFLSDYKNSDNEELTPYEKNSYASYLASIIYEYQLKFKYVGICLLTFITMLSFDFAHAQVTKNTGILPLRIGDTIPEILWDMPLQMVNHPEGKDKIRLADYRDKKLIILDFWATWCGPCIESLEGLPNLISKFGDDVLFLPTSYEDRDKISALQKSKGWNFMSEYKSNDLRSYFSFQGIPFVVWIKDNKIFSLTSAQYLKEETITKVIQNIPVQFIERNSIDRINPESPISDSNRIYSLSFGSAHPAQTGAERNVLNKLSGYNLSFLAILKTLYASRISRRELPYRIIWSVPDSIKNNLSNFKVYTGDYDQDVKIRDWRKKYLFCYKLEVDSQINLSRSQQIQILGIGFKNLMQQIHNVSFQEEETVVDAYVVQTGIHFNKLQSKLRGHQDYEELTWKSFNNKIRLLFNEDNFPIVLADKLTPNQVLICPLFTNNNKDEYINKLESLGIHIVKQKRKLSMIHVKPYSIK